MSYSISRKSSLVHFVENLDSFDPFARKSPLIHFENDLKRQTRWQWVQLHKQLFSLVLISYCNATQKSSFIIHFATSLRNGNLRGKQRGEQTFKIAVRNLQFSPRLNNFFRCKEMMTDYNIVDSFRFSLLLLLSGSVLLQEKK